jgi:hypothetical protein
MEPFPATRHRKVIAKSLSSYFDEKPLEWILLSHGYETDTIFHDVLKEQHMSEEILHQPQRYAVDHDLLRHLIREPKISGAYLGQHDIVENTEYDWHILPLTITGSPIGFLILRHSDQIRLDSLTLQFSMDLLDAMFEELDSYFSSEKLLEIDSFDALSKAFHQVLLPWLRPFQYRIVQNGVITEQHYFKIEQIETISEKIKLSQSEINIEFEYLLLTGYAPIYWIKHTFSLIKRYFDQNLYIRWKHKSAPPSREWFEDKMEFIDKSLKEVKNEMSKIPYIPSSGEASVEPFTFKLPKGKTDWIICFRGKRVNMNDKKRRDVGFEAIRLLLRDPKDTYNALVFYDMNKFTKGQKHPTYENINSENKRELEDRLRKNKEYIDEAKYKDDSYTLYDLWEDRRQLISILIEYNLDDTNLKSQYAEVKSKLQPFDELFKSKNVKKENIYSDLRLAGNYHNTATTLQKGIKAAIALMDNADFREYLEVTIITSKKGEHEPFSYIPELSNIVINYWDTE